MIRKSTASWQGSGRNGKGTLTSQSGVLAKTPFGYSSRFADGPGTNPEELLAAAHAGCFTMAVAFGLQLAGFHHGYFWEDENAVVTRIRESGARLLFVAITSPKKENFINRWRDRLGVDFVMGVGGTFDVVAGKVKRAPVWMQKSGLEWFYRVIQEPGRMWRRYLTTNLAFMLMVLKAKYRGGAVQ